MFSPRRILPSLQRNEQSAIRFRKLSLMIQLDSQYLVTLCMLCIMFTLSSDFLTGFHKRKLAKTEAAKKKALEREKQQRQEDRREVRAYLKSLAVSLTLVQQRRMLRERAAENAAEIEKAYGATLGRLFSSIL